MHFQISKKIAHKKLIHKFVDTLWLFFLDNFYNFENWLFHIYIKHNKNVSKIKVVLVKMYNLLYAVLLYGFNFSKLDVNNIF